MKVRKAKWLVILMVVAMLVTLVPAIGGAQESENGNGECGQCEPELIVDLIAGQNMVVGSVTVTNDAEKVCVTYALDEDALAAGWLLYETHLYIGATDDFPLSKPNKRLGEPYFANPIPGQFPYGDDELGGVPQWTFCISLEELGVEYCDELYVSAHAVVKRFAGYGDTATSAVIYGNIGGYETTGQGDIWEIDPIDRSETKIFECPAGVDFAANWYPNALAYDEDNHRLYFTTSKNTLVFYDFSSYDDVAALTSAGTITNSNDVLGATFGDGAYWYILNQTNMLYRVDLDGAGMVTGFTSYAMPTGGVKLSQGDIVYEDGMIFGSSGTGAGNGDNLKGFFTYEIATGEFNVVYQGDSSFAAPQLAWGLDADGNKVLYGTLGGAQQTIWTIDTTTGDMTPVTVAVDSDEPFVTENRYQDLASRFVYGEVWEDETAWGEGSRFNERGNWGTWFNYKLCPPVVECDEWIVYGSNLGINANPLGFADTSSDAIFRIDLNNKSVSVAYDPGNIRPDQNYPNGNAYDPVNQWLLFATEQGNIYIWDMVAGQQYGPFFVGSGQIASGGWYDGNYYYVPQGTRTLYKVSFTMNGATPTGATRLSVGTVGVSVNYGDIVFDIHQPGVMYGNGSGYFYKYDMITGTSTILKTGVPSLQLAYASNGKLYGVGARTGDWYEIGTESPYEHTLFWEASTWNGHTIMLTDLANGPMCE